MNRHLARSLVVLVFSAMVVGSASAASAEGELGLSSDGVSWSDSINSPLLNPGRLWVPGDVERASFFVRNQGPTSARLVISVRSADTDDLLANDDVTLRARAAGGDWVRLRNGTPSDGLTNDPIARSATSEIEVDVTFDPAAGNATQRSSVSLSLVVTLSDARVDPDGTDPDDDGAVDDSGAGPSDETAANGGGLLPSIGSRGSAGMLWVGLIMLGVGLAVVRGTRAEVRRG